MKVLVLSSRRRSEEAISMYKEHGSVLTKLMVDSQSESVGLLHAALRQRRAGRKPAVRFEGTSKPGQFLGVIHGP